MLTAQPAAPVAGRNSGTIWKRVCGSWPHQPDKPRGRIAEMPLVHEAPADRAGAGVQILVRAPHGEVDIPVVQLQRQIADGMRHVETDNGALGLRGRGDARAIERLAGAVLHAGPEHERELAAQFLDLRLDVVDAQGLFTGARRELYQRFFRIELVPRELAENGVAVR